MSDIKAKSVDRRNFLKSGATSALFLGSGLWVGDSHARALRRDQIEGSARNIIFLVSDGMSMGTLSMADHMLRRRDGRASNWATLYEQDRARRSQMDMASLDSIVTDSSAASSSWGCGKRINNGGVNIGPDGEEYRAILPIFKDAGKSTGLVTTTTITHATPAGFAANVPSRDMEEEIAVQYLGHEVDVLLGGGNRLMDPSMRSDSRDLYQDFRDAGYQVVRDKTGLQASRDRAGSLLGIFYDGHVPYTLDHINSPEYIASIPTLAEMTDVALRRLSRNNDGFILQVEGGRVDHAAHSNDVGGLIFDQIAFDEAIGVVLEFAENRNDTLVIITTDHGNANPGLNGVGMGYKESNDMFDRLQNFRQTNDWILSGLDDNSRVEQIIDRVEAATALQITDREAFVLQESLRGQYRPLYGAMSEPQAALGQILANYVAVNFIGRAHTSDLVELASLGPASESIAGLVRNTELFDLMITAGGVLEWAGS